MNLKRMEALCPLEPANPNKIHVKKVHGYWWAWLPAQSGWTAAKKSDVIFNRVSRALKKCSFDFPIFGRDNYDRD